MPPRRALLAACLLPLVSLVACETPPPVMPSPAPPTTAAPTAVSTALAPSATAAPAPVPEGASGYEKPPQNILDVLHAPSPPQPSVNPTHDTILLVSWQDYPPMTRVATPFLRLAGVRIEPRNHSRHDTPGGYGITPCATDYTLVRVADGSQLRVALPPGACAGRPSWSADGKRFAFQNIAADAVELWLGDATTGEAHRVPGVRLNPMLGSTVQWMADQKTLLVKTVPDGLGAPPPAPVVPRGPSIQETGGEKGESSTYETRDTLSSRHDEDLFDYYVSSQLALVDAATGAVTPAGKPGAYDDVDVAPDGQHILVESIHKPYSYVTTYDRFPHDVDVWDRSGAPAHRVASLPLADRVPIHGVPTGPRDFAWRQTEPSTLVWAEALDGGDWNVKVPARDKVMLHKAPFSGPVTELTRTEQRFSGFMWSEQPGTALLREDNANKHWTRTFVMNVDDARSKPRLLWDHSTDEHYKDPGNPVYRELPNGAWVIQQSGQTMFLSGSGSSPEGDRPFLDRLDLATQKTERLFRSDKAAYDWFLAFTGPDTSTFMTWHQSPMDPPNAFLRTLGPVVPGAPAGEAAYASSTRAVTHVPDPTPAVRAIKKRLVKYKRKDGVDLSFTLYTPPDYKEGTRVPAVLYAYPLDYADASKAGQVTGSEETFTRLRQYKLLLLAGYAIIDQAAFPIVGDPKKAYDTYLEQLVADAKAAVDKAVELGVVDPERIGITGHSHGALMTANLVAHSGLFRAGVATSGSYNKTLTPFGFQNERRSVWEAQSVYLKVSPFFYADKLKTPLLIMHGEDDANPGTTPLQSTKLYEAIRGNGGTARLVMLPHEPHWYAAMESNEQLIFEMLRWFDKYVKNAPPRAGGAVGKAAR
ncbi:MAG TPA: prolyl oligopeptidase family serine peptidase [Polyangiaceae bacterium]|jgi:dipeptidyl aminopeptidase/acylaminoacyl peptidase